jgi:hypothetical protein
MALKWRRMQSGWEPRSARDSLLPGRKYRELRRFLVSKNMHQPLEPHMQSRSAVVEILYYRETAQGY